MSKPFPNIEPFRSTFKLGPATYRSKGRKGVPPWLLQKSYDKEWHPPLFNNLSQLCYQFGLTLKGHWRLTESWPCHSTFLPNVIGWLVATDGVMAIVLRADQEKWWEVHLDSLVIEKEEVERVPSQKGPRQGQRQAEKLQEMLSKYD